MPLPPARSMDAHLMLPSLLLASGSPRRMQLMRGAGWEPIVRPVPIDERRRAGEAPADMARRLAREKAGRAASTYDEAALVLAADTIVVDGDQVLGKPENAAAALSMLMSLRDRRHLVITALALMDRAGGRLMERTTRSELAMRDFSRQQAEAYVAGGSPLDKAGAYGIQDKDFNLVDFDSLADCFANVMGLPLCTLAVLLSELGYDRAATTGLVDHCHNLHPGRHPQVAV